MSYARLCLGGVNTRDHDVCFRFCACQIITSPSWNQSAVGDICDGFTDFKGRSDPRMLATDLDEAGYLSADRSMRSGEPGSAKTQSEERESAWGPIEPARKRQSAIFRKVAPEAHPGGTLRKMPPADVHAT